MEPPEQSILDTFHFISPDTGSIVALVIMLLLLVLSALISGSEVAFFSLSPSEIQTLQEVKETDKNTLRANELLEHPKKLLATILIANNTVNVAIVLLSTILVDGLLHFPKDAQLMQFLVQVVAVTFLIVLFGEITPKVYATNNAHQSVMRISNFIYGMQKVFSPLSKLLISTSNFIDSAVEKKAANISVDELGQALELTYNNEETTDDEKKILEGIVKFGSTEVQQIMTSRQDVVSLSLDDTFQDVINTIIKCGYSRIPVFKDEYEQIAGVLYIKDLLKHINDDEFDWQSTLRQAYFVPENKKIDDLLNEFQKRKIHLAVVVDEHGSTQGIVTLEDVLEEIVGEISDEYDDVDVVYSKLDDYNYVFEGKTPLGDMYKILQIDGEEFEEIKGEASTIAGFLLEQTGKILKKNERFSFGSYSFVVESADKRKIIRVKITLAKDHVSVQKD